MAKAQANKSVYKRVSASLSSADNGTGAMDSSKFNPKAQYNRKTADTSNGKALYNRKSSGASAANTANDVYQTKGSTKTAVKLNGSKGGKFGKYAD